MQFMKLISLSLVRKVYLPLKALKMCLHKWTQIKYKSRIITIKKTLEDLGLDFLISLS